MNAALVGSLYSRGENLSKNGLIKKKEQKWSDSGGFQSPNVRKKFYILF
jgi:hypothetical protein